MGNTDEFTEVGRRLHEEHTATLAIFNDIEDAILSRKADSPLDMGKEEDRETLERLISVMRRDVTRHFDFEEQAVFPLLREKGAADIVDMLTHEHTAIKPIAYRLEEIASHALTDGFDDATWGEFRLQVIELMERESFHIQKEEMGLVRGLLHFLDPEQDLELARQYDES